MKIYVVTADTHDDGYGSSIELLRVADNETERDESVKYAKRMGWYPTVEEIELNKPVRRYLGGYIE